MNLGHRAVLRTTVRIAAALLVSLSMNVAVSATPRLVFETVLRGEGEVALRWPIAIASAAPDEIVVAEIAPPSLVVFRLEQDEWQVARSIPLTGTSAAIAGARAGEQYLVATRGPGALFLLDRVKWTLRSIALPSGSRPGAVAGLRDGGFLVHDVGNGQIISLAASGAVSGRTPAPARMVALAAAPDGGFYTVDAVGGRIIHHGPDGTERAAWTLRGDGPRSPFPCALALRGNGEPMALDRHTARLLRLVPGGRVESLGGGRGQMPGRFFYPRGIAALGNERFAIADLGNGRIQIVRLEERD